MTPQLAVSGGRLALLVALFYLGWVKFQFDGTTVYFIDYAERLAIIALAWAFLRQAFTPPWPRAPLWLWAVALGGSVAILFLDHQTADLIEIHASALLPIGEADFPPLEDDLFLAFDMTAGLALVAVSEELVFRCLWMRWWQQRNDGSNARVAELYLGSSLVFGMLHMPLGQAQVLFAILWGLLLMFLYRRSGSLPLVVLVHFAVDVWYFT